MQVTLSVRHGELPQDLREHAREQVNGLSKYFDRLVEADIILEDAHPRHIAEVRLHTSTDTHFARTEATTWRAAIDGTIDKLRRQLKRHKAKLIRHSLSRQEREQLEAAGRSFIPDEPDPTSPPPEWDRISSREAIGRLETSGEEVLVFVESKTGVVKIARRDDEGTISVVEADAFEVGEP